MKSKTVIDATIEHLFKNLGDQQITKAFFYRAFLNWTPLEVARELNISKNTVNNLNSARLFRRSERTKYGDFNASYEIAYEAVQKFVTYKRSKNHLNHVRSVENRLRFKHNILTTKLNK